MNHNKNTINILHINTYLIISRNTYKICKKHTKKYSEPIKIDQIVQNIVHYYDGNDIPNLTYLGMVSFIDPIREEVKDAIKKYTAVYFGATGGAGALYSEHIVASEIVAYEDLGTEAIRKLTVKDFPVTVV